MSSVSVVVRFRFEGVHSWPECPLPDVQFLRDPHRHVFHVTAAKAVTHDERDIEFIMLARQMEAYCKDRFAGPHFMSCETMARNLVQAYGLVRCEVSEDGENGAEVVA